MTDCSHIHEALPLLRYGNELSAEERLKVLAHLEECSPCRSLRDRVEATAASLDAVPLERPDPQRLLSLKARVLDAVSGCPQEALLLSRDDLSPTEQIELEAHLHECGSCQEAARDYERVGQALDRIPLPRPAGLDGLRERVLAQIALAQQPALARPRGLLIRLLPALALAAALLLAVNLGFQALVPAPAPLDAAQLSALKDGADELLRDNRKDEAMRIYELLLEQGHGNRSPEAARLLASVQRSLDAIARLEQALSAQDTELVITYYPDSPVVPPALAQWAAQKSAEPQVAPAIQQQPTISLDPVQIAELRLSTEVRNVVGTSRSMQQVVLLQQGLRYEDLGQLASAREAFEQAIELDPETEAARLARKGLARLA